MGGAYEGEEKLGAEVEAGVAGLGGLATLSTSMSARGVDLGADMCVIQGVSYDAQQDEVAC